MVFLQTARCLTSVLTLSVLASYVGAQPASSGGTTYLRGDELALQYLANVATLTVVGASPQKGAAFFIGVDDSHSYWVTAAHVVKMPEDSLRKIAIMLRACATDQAPANAELVGLWDGEDSDVAVVRVRRSGATQLSTEVLARQGRLSKSDDIWSIGREGECKVGGAVGRFDSRNSDQLIVGLPGGSPGSSGSVLMSGWGIVGMTVRNCNFGMICGISIESVRRTVTSHQGVVWQLTDSKNVPPLSEDAARNDLTSTLNRYLFDLHDIHALLQQEVAAKDALADTITRYNASYGHFYAIKDIYDGTLVRVWSSDHAARLHSIRNRVERLHARFLDIKERNLVPPIYRSGKVPDTVREVMREISGELVQLRTEIRTFISSL